MSNSKVVMSQAANTLTTPLEVEDVFSTYLYEGNGSTQTITNGIDLDGEGGLVWAKIRNFTSAHGLWDTERGVQKRLSSNTTDAEQTNSNTLTAFNSAGFTLGSDASYNASGYDFASWTFRKAPKFFDVQTWSGDSTSGRAIPHNLGTTPGMIIVKWYDGTQNWAVWHKDLAAGTFLLLNETNSVVTNSNVFTTTSPTDSVFYVGADYATNGTSANYVAYLFAHNDGDGEFGPDGDADIIKCGSYTGNGSSQHIDLGFEPQFVLIKRASGGTSSWLLHDTMRGIATGGNDTYLKPDTSDAEVTTGTSVLDVTSTGFHLPYSGTSYNASGSTYIYIAIRRGTKVPESGTEVFAVDTQNSTSGSPAMKSAFPVDMATLHYTTNTLDKFITSRLTQGERLETSSTDAEAIASEYQFDYSNGWWVQSGTNSTRISHMWKRAPNFFDVVTYTGDGTSGRTVSHNLGVAPEMMWVKCRTSSGRAWEVYHSGVAADAETDYLRLNSTQAVLDDARFWQDTKPTESVFTLGFLGGVNASGDDYIAYLFASLAGISKVGSYTGNGSSQTIDCGFSSGARFILIKRTDSTGDWYVWDTERGIVAGNDPHLSLNTTAAQVTSDDSIDPDSSGFIVNQVAATNINVSSAEYIFYAIA
jgi:hypothetical protein